MPKVDMDMEMGTIADWHVEEGQNVRKGDPLFDIETDKAAMEVESPSSGVLHFVTAKTGDEIQIGMPVAWIFAEDEDVVAPEKNSTNSDAVQVGEAAIAPQIAKTSIEDNDLTSGKNCRATPLARRLAREHKLQLSALAGSGARGRITRSDIEKFLENHAAAAPAVKQQRPSIDPIAIAKKIGLEYTHKPVDRIRATIARRLTESKTTVPHFYLDADCRIDALLTLRQQINTTLALTNAGKISVNDLIVRACALTLKQVPEANVSWAGDKIIQYAEAHISVAIAIDGGLVTPVVRRAETKDIQTIAEEIADFAMRARSGKLAPEEYQGGSFSVSNLGMFGVKSFAAVINPPESMILAVGAGERQFVPDENDNPIAATIMSVKLSCDHRVVDGAVGAKWLQHFKSAIENPAALLL